jgi:fatty-acyl-CoA synthase
LGRRLPPYAIPVFLRLCRTLDTTETFKQQKQRLVREKFDRSIADDPMFFRHPADGLYRPLDADVRARIADGGIRF